MALCPNMRLAEMGRNLHPNLLPLSKRRRVTGGDVLGLEMEDPAQELTSGDDSGVLGMSEPDTETSSKGLFLGPDSDGFSMDVSDRARDRARGGQRHCGCGTWTMVRMSVTTDSGRAGD